MCTETFSKGRTVPSVLVLPCLASGLTLCLGLGLTLGLTLCLAPAPAAAADMCDTDEDPAATLLLPYFEVDLDDPSRGNTLFSINNAWSEPALAHVTLWTDWSHPTINFDVFLTGYDVLQVNLADLFLRGDIPVTADSQSDPGDSVSPHGFHPEFDGDFPGCQNFFPFFVNPLIRGPNFERLVDGHTGRPLSQLGGSCFGADHDDNVARGYVTIDRVNRCSVAVATDDDPEGDDYFAEGGTGIASNENQLWGDWLYVDRSNAFAQGDALVHIEALDGFDAAGDGTSLDKVPDPPSGYTFYGRYASAGEDNREPLGATWSARYLNNQLFEGGTDLTVWRDAARGQTYELGYGCGPPQQGGAGPAWHPLRQSLVVAFDEFENSVEFCRSYCGVCSQKFLTEIDCFPLGTQKMSSQNLGFSGESPPWGAGWIYLDLRFPPGDEGLFGLLSQSFVSVSHSAQGLFSVGLPALETTSACAAVDDSPFPGL